jgi:hypothetical protein
MQTLPPSSTWAAISGASLSIGQPRIAMAMKWSSSHGINIRNGICSCYFAKIKGVIHNGHEKIGRRDDRLPILPIKYSGIVSAFIAN